MSEEPRSALTGRQVQKFPLKQVRTSEKQDEVPADHPPPSFPSPSAGCSSLPVDTTGLGRAPISLSSFQFVY